MKRFLILGIVFLVPSCAGWFYEKPAFNLKEIAVTRISLNEIHFLFGIEVQNPNRLDLKLRALEYKAFIEDRQVGSGRLEREVLIAKTSATLIQIPLKTDFKSLGDPLALVLSGKDLRYKIEGAAIVKAALGTTTFPFSKSGEIKIRK